MISKGVSNINPKGVTKASTVLNHFGRDFVAFGNDQNDISLFKNAIYGVQIGDYPYLKTLRMRLFLQLMQLLLKN